MRIGARISVDDTTSIVEHKRHAQCRGELALAASVIARKRISAAVAGLILLTLALLRSCPVFHPILIPLRLVPAFVLFLFLPGFMLLNWLLPEMVKSFVETIPLALGVSLAFWAPVLLVMLMLAVSPTTLLLVALLALLVLFVAYLILASNVDEREIHLSPAGRGFWIVWCGMALTCALMIYIGGRLSGHAAGMHLHILRRVVDGTRLSRGYVAGGSITDSRCYIFPLLHIVDALISMLAGVEPAHAWYYGPALLEPTSLLTIYLLAKALFKSDFTASLSTPAYLLTSFYFLHDGGVRCWNCTTEARFMNMLILLPATLTLLVHYLRCQSSRVWALGGVVFVLGCVMGAIHACQLFFMLAWLVVFPATYLLLIGWNRQVLVRAVGIVLVFALFLVLLLWLVHVWLPDHNWSYFNTIQRDNVLFAPDEYGSYMDDIRPLYLMAGAIALFPLLLAVGRRTLPLVVAFVFAGLIAPPLLRLEPHILSVAMQVIPSFWRMHEQVQFFVSVLIVTATISALLPLLDRRVVHPGVLMARRMSTRARWGGFLGTCATGALLVWLIIRWQFLKDFILYKELKLSPLPFFAYLALVGFLAVLARFRLARDGPRGVVSRVWSTEAERRYPLPTVTVAAACLVFLTIPGLFWLPPIHGYQITKGQPLLESDLNTEAVAARFHGTGLLAPPSAEGWWDPGLINFLRDHTTEDAVIWGFWLSSRLVPVYVNRRFIGNSQRGGANWADVGKVENLRQPEPTYVLLARPFAPSTDMNDLIYLNQAFRAGGELFEPVYESARVALFRLGPTSQGTAELQLNHVLAGNVYSVEEEWGKAIAEYEAALALDSDDTLAHLGLGRAYQAQGKMAKVIAELVSKGARQWTDQAQDKMEKAIAELERAVAASPEDEWAHFYLGQAYAELAEVAEDSAHAHLQKAAEAYRRSWALGENAAAGERLAETCENLEEWCQQSGVLDEVVAHFEKEVELDPEDGELQLDLAHWYQVVGRYEEAVVASLRAADLCPEDAEVYFSLGEAYLAQHRMDDAVAAFERAIELEPVRGHVSVAQLYEREGRMDEANAHYLAAADAADGFVKAGYLGKTGQIYEAQGQFDRAVAQYLTAAQATVDTGAMRAWYRCAADVYLAAGNPEGARCLVRSVLWNERRNAGSWSLAVDVYPGLIEWYKARGETTRARAMAWELLGIVPEHEAALQALTYYDFIASFSAAEVEVPENPFPLVRITGFTVPATWDQRAVLFVFPRARVSYRLEVPPEPSVLRFSPAVNPETRSLDGDGSTFEIYVIDEGEHRLLFSEHVGNDPKEQGHDREVSLAPYAGQEVTITFVTQPAPGGDFTGSEAGWANPRVMRARTEEWDFWDYSEEEIQAADTLKTSPELFTTLQPLD